MGRFKTTEERQRKIMAKKAMKRAKFTLPTQPVIASVEAATTLIKENGQDEQL